MKISGVKFSKVSVQTGTIKSSFIILFIVNYPTLIFLLSSHVIILDEVPNANINFSRGGGI